MLTSARFFNAKGFHATSLDDVAQALNVTKPTIYHYFSSKDEILFECVRLGLDAILEAAENVAVKGGTGREKLEALMLEYGMVMTRDFGICVTRTSDDQLSEASRNRFRALKREIHDAIQDVVEEGMRDGSLALGDARIKTFTLAGSLNWIARWYRPDGDMTPEQVARGTVDTLIEGLAPRGDY